MPPDIQSQRGFDTKSGQLFYEAFYKATDFISSKIPVLTFIKYILAGVNTLADYGVGMMHAIEGVGFPRDLDVDLVRFIARGSQILFQIYFQTLEVNKALKRNLPRIGGCFACLYIIPF